MCTRSSKRRGRDCETRLHYIRKDPCAMKTYGLHGLKLSINKKEMGTLNHTHIRTFVNPLNGTS